MFIFVQLNFPFGSGFQARFQNRKEFGYDVVDLDVMICDLTGVLAREPFTIQMQNLGYTCQIVYAKERKKLY